MAEQDITLVYGGGRVGLMGVLADAVLEVGGRVVGVIPKILYRKEIAHQDLTELRVVDSMSERKAVIGELSDAFIALPGGIGTLDEIFEVWTWTQLGLQHKYSGLLNVGGYFDPLIEFVDRAVREGFLSAQNRDVLFVETNAARLLARLSADPGHERQEMSGD
jgi:uncharacterized protein (TIGR00730 family)